MGQGNSTHPIHSAGRTGNVCVVRRYLKNPAILNRRDDNEMTCLHWAAQLGHIDIVQELIAAGAGLDAQDVNGWTPLMHACCRGHKMVVSAMLSAGAGVDIESHDGRTALHRAATWKRLWPLDQLIEAGGDVAHKAGNKWTPLHCAAAAGDANACAILLDAGADPDAEDELGLKPVDVIADTSTAETVTLTLNQLRLRATTRSTRPPAALPVTLDSLPPSASDDGRKSRGGGGVTEAKRVVETRASPSPNAVSTSVLRSSGGSGSLADDTASSSISRETHRPRGKPLVADVARSIGPLAAPEAHGVPDKQPENGGRDPSSNSSSNSSSSSNMSPKRGSWSRPTVAPRYQPRGCGGGGGGSKISCSPGDSPGCVRDSPSKEVGGSAGLQVPEGILHDGGSATLAG